MKNKHGGRRPGAGRKPRKDERETRVVKVALTDEEFGAVKALLNTDSRRVALMAAIERGEEPGEDE